MSLPASPIYVLDDWRARQLRSWQMMIPGHLKARWEAGPGSRPRPMSGAKPVSSGLLIAHRSAVGDMSTLRTHSDAHSALTVVVVSGEEQTDQNSTSGLYFRRAQVGKPDDPEFTALFRKFREVLEDGERDFSLLEPDPVPHSLVAAYLLVAGALLGQDRAPEKFDQANICGHFSPEFWSEALGEFARYAERKPSARTKWPLALFAGGRVKESAIVALERALERAGLPDVVVRVVRREEVGA